MYMAAVGTPIQGLREGNLSELSEPSTRGVRLAPILPFTTHHVLIREPMVWWHKLIPELALDMEMTQTQSLLVRGLGWHLRITEKKLCKRRCRRGAEPA